MSGAASGRRQDRLERRQRSRYSDRSSFDGPVSIVSALLVVLVVTLQVYLVVTLILPERF
jgi:K+-transporting ATPase KdpF subunit